MSNTKKWTPSQELAINTRDKTLLISAAAGSGKTATLTERIIRSLTDKNAPADISRMLIVTFTVAAASELKQRISAALSSQIAKNPADKHLSRQLIMLESAQISTIDSFCYSVVRENFQRLSLPSGFKIADTVEIHLLHKEIIESIIEERYNDNDTESNDFLYFVENFIDTKESVPLSSTLLDLYNKLDSRAEGVDYIKACADELYAGAEKDFFLSLQGKIICEHLIEALTYYQKCYSKALDALSSTTEAQNAYFRSFSYDKSFIDSSLDALRAYNYVNAKKHLSSYTPLALGSLKAQYKTEETELCRNMRADFTSFIAKTAIPKYFSLSQEEISETIKKSADVLRSVYSLLKEFEARSKEEKFRRKIFGFNDITRFATQILSDEQGNPSDVARAYAEKYDQIYIDEYQDVSPIQDYLFRLVSRPDNRFMVGDIKQSIYSFRNADPDIFSGYRRKFPLIKNADDAAALNSPCASIFMSNNFRCDENIIKFTNKIFSNLFSNCGESISYTKDDELKFSKVEDGRTMPSPKVSVRIIHNENLKNEDYVPYEENKEAIWVANEIHRLLKNEKKADGTPIEPRDIAILIRQKSSAYDFADALKELGIPCSSIPEKDVFNTPDVLLMLSLLSVVDNPQRDIPLAATLYSPLFRFTMDELIQIRESADSSYSLFEALKGYLDADEKDTEIERKSLYFLEKLCLFRDFSISSPIDKLISFIYDDTSILSMESSNQSNLIKLYELARTFESGSFKGLNNFITYVSDLIEDEKTPDSFGKEDDSSNTVKILSMHKSKGLEFPVCFVSSTQTKFNFTDLKKPILYDSHAGISFRLAHRSGFAKLNTPLREAAELRIKASQKEEEMRILYVALTRARERLYVTADIPKPSSAATIESKAAHAAFFPGAFEIKSAANPLPWILAAIYPPTENDVYSFEFIHGSEIDFVDVYDLKNTETTVQAVDKDKASELISRVDFKYPYAHLNKLPAKLSVSKLSPTVLDDVDNDSLTLDSSNDVHILDISEFFESKSKETSAAKGTATHLFLQFCDFENASENGVECELARLVEKRFISPSIAKLINKKQLDAFFKSEFFKSLSHAERIYREQRFNILLPASHFTGDAEFEQQISDEKILVQGVIDLFFTTSDGKIIVCDYKTDHLTDEEQKSVSLATKKLKERHGDQLSYYSMAIEQMCGKKPNKIYIYSLPFGEALEIE